MIILLGFGLRFYKLNIPLADHHSWRQADTAAVARNFAEENFDFLRPRIDNLAPLHAPDLPNPQRLFLAEPPIYNSIVAVFYRLFGVKESLARLVSVFFYLGSGFFLFFLLKDAFSESMALWAVFYLVILPFGVFYSRAVLPESLMIFVSSGMLFTFSRWLEKKSLFSFLTATVFAALALTQKAFPFFLGLPMAYLLLKKWGVSFLTQKKKAISLLVYLVLISAPIFFWRQWIHNFPQGIPPFDWLFNQGGIRFRPAFFRWIFFERIGKLILGIWGLPLFCLGLAVKVRRKFGWFFHLWLIAFLIYVFVLASGNVTHDYYQIPFLPLAAIFLARGTDWLLKASGQSFSRIISYLLFFICSVFMLAFSWYQVRDFYFIQGGVDLAGRAVDLLTPKEALVLTGDSNDATLLYNCHRHGFTGGYASYFPNDPESLERARSQGASVYVTTKISELEFSEFGRYLRENYQLIQGSNQYLIFDLR